MKTIRPTIAFSFKNIISKDAQNTPVLHSALKSGFGIFLLFVILLMPRFVFGQAAASTNYALQTGNIGTTYSWIDCSAGTSIISGDDAQASISWPFDFTFYDNTYSTSNSLSVCTNGFIRLDGTASTSYQTASAYTLSSSSTELGQIIAMAVIDGNVSGTGWIKSLVSGTSPNRVFTIEYNDFEIDYNDNLFADVQVSFYETSNKVVLKLGDDNITTADVEMGIHSGVAAFYNKWQEAKTGANNAWMEYTPSSAPPVAGPQASWNYGTQTGTTGSTYYWINCESGTTIVSGDDAQAQINWPFDFSYYDNDYTTSDQLSVTTNGFIRIDDIATTEHTSATNYDLTSTATNLGQIIAMAVYDGNVSGTGWIRSLVSGSTPNRIFTIEYNDIEIDYNDNKFADAQVSFYESSNKIVLKLGTDNIAKSGVDMGLHSGVNTYFNDWQEIKSGTNNTWIEYTPHYIEVNATIGTSPAYYPTLKDAFDKVNDGTHQGAITVKVNHSTTETASAVLNASGSGSANYASINMYPTKTGLSISGNIPAPLVDLSGADNVTINGSLNASGATKELSLVNTSTASYGGNSAIRFINGATNNTVKYCTIKSSESRSNYGILFFSSTNTSSGNSNNTIDNNDITNAGARPVNAIYSVGTDGKGNNGNIISNNNIYDFLKHASASRGISLNANTTEWTIDGNSFYETTEFAPTGTVTYEIIRLANVDAGGYIVSNNYIGGSAPQCGGSAWTKTNNNKNLFNAIYLNLGTTVASSLQNNTIQNINWSNSGIATWKGINVNKGSVDIGTVTGNTIGATTGTNSISVTGGANGQYIYAMYLAGTGVINCNNNNIGSITSITASTYGTYIYGIGLSGTVTATIENNTIGSTTTANSIYASSASTANTQKVYGIYTKSTGTTVIHKNTISNLRNNTSNAAVGTRGFLYGIYLTYGTNTVNDNTIRDLSIENANTSTYSPSIAGINLITNATNAQSIHGNLIYNISNTSPSFTGCVIGLFSRNPLGAMAGDISANLVHSLSVDDASTGAKVYGIYENTDGIVYTNNIIALGGSTSTEMYGIYDVGNTGKTGRFFFNSIYLSGTNSGSEKSYALRYNTNNNIRDLRNNILFNARSGGSGGHYAIYYDATGGTYTADNNDYYVTGIGGVLGRYSSDKATLALLQSATGQDANSLDINPVFATPGGISSSDYISTASLPGVVGTGITTDYDDVTRANPPKMGALEFTLSYVWQGNTSTNFGTASNWENGVVPPNGSDISFATTPDNDCYLDQNRVVRDITNSSDKIFNLNGRTLTLTGDIISPTANQIDASSSSLRLLFSGEEAQSIPSGVLVANTVGELEQANSHGLTLDDDITVLDSLILTDGPLIIGANTLTINGAIQVVSGSLTGSSTSSIVIGGSGASTTLPVTTLKNLTLNRSNGMSLGENLTVSGTLALTSGTLTIGANTLTISGSSPTRVNGNIDPSHTASLVVLANPSPITCPEGLFNNSLNNVTINGIGISPCCSCTINGILNLESANPSSIKGTLDMGTDTLTMGPNATTIGIGDVTGVVRRAHTFAANTEYSFGSQYTTFTFVDSNIKPTWICVKISIGSIPGWTPWTENPNGKVKRLYQVSASDNSSTSQANINMRYLQSELDATYNDESKLIFWHKFATYSGGLPHEHGKSNQDLTNRYLGISGLTFGVAASTNLDSSQVAIAYSVLTKNTWKGEVTDHQTEWEQPHNWTSGTVPMSTEDVLIPGGLDYYPSLTASANAVAKSIEIETGASITANAYDITVSGSGGAWINHGTLYPGTGKVLFNHGVSTEIVTIAGTTDFYNIEIGVNTTMQPVTGSILRIAGAGSADMTSIVDFSTVNNTVEWNGANQTIVNPNGISGSSGYYKLILSGSGIKTMPATAMTIADELKISGTATVTAASALTIGDELEILEGATFATGNYDHTVGGHFDNRGTFTASAGTKITLNGTTMQEIYGGSPSTFEKLTIENAAGVDIHTEITVNDALTLTSGNLNVNTTTLTLNGAVTKAAGFINTSSSSSLTFGGTTALTLAGSLFYTTPSIDTLTVNRSGGVIFESDLTINSTLHLLGANPSSGTIGSLDMGTNTLTMGANATTVGAGDVTGIVKRTTILADTEYTFGNQFTSATFPNIGTLPTEISVKISIGSAPSWNLNAVQRFYDLIHIGGSDTRATLKGHYLNNELNGNIESDLIDVTYVTPLDLHVEQGRSDIDTTENWVLLSNLDFSKVPTSFGVMELSFAESTTDIITWNGSISTDWNEPSNWTPSLSPDTSKITIIPDASTTARDPLLPANDSIYSVLIHADGVLNSGANSELTVVGAGGAWENYGTFNASTGKVIFKNSGASNIVTIAGETNFYNIEAGENTTVQPVAGCTLRIAGSGMAYASSVVDFSNVNNTVEWNGDNQTIVNPNGIGGNAGYYNLILSGSGTKTMPTSAMTISGDLTTTGAATATAADSLLINGNLTIGTGSTFSTGTYNHLLAGNFENDGTFNAGTGSNFIFNGTTVQTIDGSSTTDFDILTTDNTEGISQLSAVNISNSLDLNNGNLTVGNTTLGINGTINNPSGNLNVSSVSSLSFGGTATLTLNNNLFNGDPTLNDLTIDRPGGLSLGNENFTVEGTLALTDGTLTIGANTLTLKGNSPTRTNGNIDASNDSAKLVFENTSAIILPSSMFNTNVNDLTVSGIGGVTTDSSFSIDGILSLQGTNPSSTKGSLDMGAFTLNMGVNSTTTGSGDVTGIVRREHTFDNGVDYSFGNQHTTLNFLDVPGNTKPTWINCKIEIGVAPTWRSEAINRNYSFAQAGGNDRMIVKLHYLDSELHGTETDETQLVFWDAYNPDLVTPNSFSHFFPRNHNGTNSSDNWIQLTGPAINYLATSSTLDVKQWGLGYTNVSVHKWIGLGSPSYPGDWSLPGHWEGGVPQADNDVLIPTVLPEGNSGYPYRNLLPVVAPAQAKTIEIQPSAILTSDGSDITVTGFGNAWINNGLFSPGTGTVIFHHSDDSEVVNITGTSNFNNLTINDKTHIQAAANSSIKVNGIFTAISGSLLDFTSHINTVEYNGSSSQDIINPTADAISGYHHLIISGTGTKTWPSSSLNIEGDLSSNATSTATGNTLVLNGTTAQSISGSVAPSLNNLTITNITETVTSSIDINCLGAFTNSGVLDMTTSDLGVTGTVTNTGTVKTASTSSTPLPSAKSWNGTVEYYTATGAQTIVSGTYNTLTLSNTSGTQSASGAISTTTLNNTSNAAMVLDMVTYDLGVTTLNNSGTILTQSLSETPISSGLTIGGTVNYNATTGGQTVVAASSYSTLTMNNTSGTQTASGAIVANTLNTMSGGTLDMVTYALSGLTAVSHLGTMRTQNTSSTPFTSGLSWGGTILFDAMVGQTLPAAESTFDSLTLSNTAGVTAAADQTVNGVLNLSVANPDATHGSLDMSTHTLNMGANASTTGIGDVTGIMTRTSFVVNKTYTYGNANQYVLFPEVAGQTLPTSFSLRVTLLATAPTWVDGASKRLYEIAQTGGVDTKATFRTNYLDDELASGASESVLSFWHNIFPFEAGDVLERGWSDYNIDDNWITFSDADFGNIPSALGYFKVAIAPTQVEYRTWNGSQSTTTWNAATNWTPQGIPSSSLGVVIPDVDSSYSYSPDLPTDAVGKYLIIQDGGVLNTLSSAVITLSGNGNVWSMEDGGSFNAGNSSVLLAGDTADGVVRISGTTDFYDLTISDSTSLRPGLNSYIGISNTMTNNGILDAAADHNTIEFKQDGDYTISNPNGETPGFHNLIISGTGTKTLPSSLNIWHDFINNGTVSAGTSTVTFDGMHSGQIIGGSSNTGFYDLTIANTDWEVTTEANITVSNNLTINADATLNPGASNTIGGTGTLTGNGTAKVTRITATPDMATQYPIANKALTNLSVNYCGTGDQTISAHDYGNLTFCANGNRTCTLASTDTIRVSDTLDLDLTTTDYIITGSTFEANGTGAQTVPTFNYNNIIVSGDRGGESITLVNGGTIGIAGDGSVTATNANYVITNNTIDINGNGDQDLDKFTFYHLTISNSGTKTALDTLTVYGDFTIEDGLTLDMSTAPLLGTMSNISNGGTLRTSNTSAAPLPHGKTWNGIVEYAGSAAQTVATGTYQNLTMSGAGGGSLVADVLVNGILNLSHSNPSSTQGILHTNTDTLHMGASATTIGDGDVTGMVKRQHTFANGVEYTFGNPYTNLNFLDVVASTKPEWIICEINIGTAPTWRSEAINRSYSFAQSGGTDRMIVKLHYLDSELHDAETDESQLVYWDAYNPDLVTPNSFTHFFPRNHNGTDATNNWIQLTGPAINYLATSSTLDVKQWGLGYTNVDEITWIGLGSPSYPGDWSLPGHWNGGVPESSDDVVIPGTLPDGSAGYPSRNLLPVISPAMVNTLEIESDGILTLNDFDITISGATDAWTNNGTFNPGTEAIIFNNGNTSNTVTLTGNTNFYDIIVNDNTKIQPAASSIIGIGGTLSVGTGSILDFSSNENTIVYNGNDSQSMLTPNGGTTPGYHHLMLSSSGDKTFPSSLNILGDFTINASTVTSGTTTVMAGSTSQTISGTHSTTFNNLTIDNTAGVSLDLDELCTVRGTLLINTGKTMQVAAGQQLTVSGTISNNSGSEGLVLQSSEDATASLIHESDNVPATIERTITGAAEDWHFLSSPVAGQEIAPTIPTTPSWVPSGTYGNGTGYDMYLWNESSNCWIYKSDTSWNTLNSGADFEVGRGYLYSVQATNPTKEFVGNMNNGSISYGLTVGGVEDLSLQGFNLVGNPYPSSMDWMASSGWTRDNLEISGGQNGKDMWIWNPAAGNYGVCNSATGNGTNSVTRYIAPMQGFFVRAQSAGNMVSTNDVRVHDETTLWKSAHMTPSRITAVVSSERDQTSDEVRLLFGYPENSAGTAKLFSPLETAPSLYLPEENANFSIRYLSDTIANPTIALAFKAGIDGDYSINFNFDMSDFEIVILEDKLTKECIDLTTVSDYQFRASKADSENRFVLHFAPITPEVDLASSARIYTDESNLIVDLSLITEETNITVCDVMGRLLLRDRLMAKTQHEFHFSNNNHIVIVYLENKNGHLSEKVSLKTY